MKPIIISYDCVDHDLINEWVPDDPYNVDCWVNFRIGLDIYAGDDFLVRVVTPNNLRDKEPDKHAIILNEYSWSAVIDAVDGILEQCEGISWSGISKALSQHMHWEYDNYKA